MGRNKYPQETIDKIISVAATLFVEKGYENTSIQDIIDQLGGLTKGAIYHHFKSKEDIMLEVLNRQFIQYDYDKMEAVLADREMTGLEKLREFFRLSIFSPRQTGFFRSSLNLLNNPKILILLLEGIKNEAAPLWIEPVLREGIADGSIQTEYPKELAEVILLLTNLWVVPMVFRGSREELRQRIRFSRHIAKNLGADFIDDEMETRMDELVEYYCAHDEKSSAKG